MPKPTTSIPKAAAGRSYIPTGLAGRAGAPSGGADGPPSPPEPVSESRVLPNLAAALWLAAALIAGYVAVDQLNEADRLSFGGQENEALYWLGGIDFAVAGVGLALAWRVLRAPTRRILGYSCLAGAVAAVAAVLLLAMPDAPREAAIGGVLALGAAAASLLARREVAAGSA